eukprot:gene34710-9482_t
MGKSDDWDQRRGAQCAPLPQLLAPSPQSTGAYYGASLPSSLPPVPLPTLGPTLWSCPPSSQSTVYPSLSR